MTTPLETLLARAHAQPGEPQARLQDLLSALEGSDWTLLLDGEDALAAQLASVLGPGLIRLDPRLSVNRETFASRGLALASSDGDWKGARAVWLMEPDERALTRARRADVPVIVDATLSPGGLWTGQGAQFVVYRDAATLSGYGDVRLSALSGMGKAPRRSAPAAADLSVALALRDIGTLALRMNRRTRNAEALIERFQERALPVSGGVLLLEHDGPSTVTPLGGNLSAARAVSAGTLITVGIENPDDAWAILGVALGAQPVAFESDLFDAPDVQPAAQPVSHPLPDESQSIARASVLMESSSTEPVSVETAPDAEFTPMPATTEAPAVQDDYSDREFVFTPPPVLPDLPSLPSVPTQASLPSQPVQGSEQGQPAQERGRRPRRGDRRQDRNGPPAQPPIQSEIVMSESFQRGPVSTPNDSESGAPQTEPNTDSWPEEAASQTTIYDAPSEPEVLLEASEPAQELPLQLPPDLPAADAADPASDLTDEQQAIYARLREWRNAEAKRQTVSRFIIASNATLAEVARRIPYTADDLKAVKGMGPERLRKYGDKILDVVRG
ncbi:HRDC domain-containing protein [Deinococcus sp. KNUC1210]|uniref:HRDC domain-containing protein n=1 Tax=Deinococcus sp. KNUC1210 TaxID=2917691 RepID=UPI001EF0E04E|nr:HRDC domain-containing protein [Deinococcus sp. KNUC1210]ULH14556.1 HRDC domain-containing protein [Deinococcus sp. KNUC1210]